MSFGLMFPKRRVAWNVYHPGLTGRCAVNSPVEIDTIEMPRETHTMLRYNERRLHLRDLVPLENRLQYTCGMPWEPSNAFGKKGTSEEVKSAGISSRQHCRAYAAAFCTGGRIATTTS